MDTLRYVDSERQPTDTTRARRTFNVRSLGWTMVDAGLELSSSSQADDRCVHSRVNKSINRLSLGRHDITDVITAPVTSS